MHPYNVIKIPTKTTRRKWIDISNFFFWIFFLLNNKCMAPYKDTLAKCLLSEYTIRKKQHKTGEYV